MPRLRGRQLEAAEQQIGQPGTRQFVEDEDGNAKMSPSLIEPVDRPIDHQRAEALAFNEEILEVTVHTSADKNAEPIVEVFNGGIAQRFIRGQKQKVKRKFVEVLARAKQTSYSNQKVIIEGGDETYVYPESTALRYPFVVHSDPNPKGVDWLKSILAEG